MFMSSWAMKNHDFENPTMLSIFYSINMKKCSFQINGKKNNKIEFATFSQKDNMHGGILKIMILHCPNTHKHRLVFILASSVIKLISLLEETVRLSVRL